MQIRRDALSRPVGTRAGQQVVAGGLPTLLRNGASAQISSEQLSGPVGTRGGEPVVAGSLPDP